MHHYQPFIAHFKDHTLYIITSNVCYQSVHHAYKNMCPEKITQTYSRSQLTSVEIRKLKLFLNKTPFLHKERVIEFHHGREYYNVKSHTSISIVYDS